MVHIDKYSNGTFLTQAIYFFDYESFILQYQIKYNETDTNERMNQSLFFHIFFSQSS